MTKKKLKMKAYRELSKEIGQQKLQEVKYPELMRCEPGGTEDSLVGKMKTRPRRHHRYLYSNSGCPAGSSLINSHTEYICECSVSVRGTGALKSSPLTHSRQETPGSCC